MKINVRCFLLILSLHFSAKAFSQQTTCAGPSMSMQQLRQMAKGSGDVPSVRFTSVRFQFPELPNTNESKIQTPGSTVFLPRWSATDLPVFCRIEHEIARKMPVMVKFRLGSVEYVDWLEGK